MAAFTDERVQAILAGRRQIGRFPYPGGDIEVGVRLLSEHELDSCKFNAQEYLGKRAKRSGVTLKDFVDVDPEILDREHQRQILFLAILDAESNPEKPERFFKSDEQVRSIDSVTAQQLWAHYVQWQDTLNPQIQYTKEELGQLVEALKKEPTKAVILAAFERDTLQSLLLTMVGELSTSQNTKSSISP